MKIIAMEEDAFGVPNIVDPPRRIQNFGGEQ